MWQLWITAVLLGIIYLILKVRSNFKIWEQYSFPHHGFKTYMKYLGDSTKISLPQLIRENYEKNGRIFGTFQMLDPCIQIGDPDIVKEILVKQFSCFADRTPSLKCGNPLLDEMVAGLTGNEWKQTRDIITPAFTGSKMKLMIKSLNKISDYTADTMVEYLRTKKQILVKDFFGCYTLDTIARLAFAMDVNSLKDPESDFVKHAEEVFGTKHSWRLIALGLFPGLAKYFRFGIIPGTHADFFAAIVKKVVSDRLHSNNEEAIDMLQLLLNARKQEEKQEKYGKGKVKEVLSMESVIAQCILFLIAGYHTTGTTLTMVAYYLALNPEVQKKLQEEVDQVSKDEEVTYDTLNKLQYLEAVIDEALRIQPPTGIVLRYCTKETVIKGIKFTQGMRVIVPLYGMHHDPEFFSDPEEFRPERFLPENKDSIIPYSYLPFGEGPRYCIGMRLAMLSMKSIIFKVVQRLEFQRCPETPVPLTLVPKTALLHFASPIILKFVERNV